MPDTPPKSPREAPQDGKARLGKVVGGAGAAALLLGLVATFEGKANDPYKDIVGVWTVCYGETNTQMKHYTDAQCSDMLANSLSGYAQEVLNRDPNLRGHPYQLAAATSLEYNIGGSNYRKSTAAKLFGAGDLKGGCKAILRWDRAGGKRVQGLVNRRNAEYRVCMTDLGATQ